MTAEQTPKILSFFVKSGMSKPHNRRFLDFTGVTTEEIGYKKVLNYGGRIDRNPSTIRGGILSIDMLWWRHNGSIK